MKKAKDLVHELDARYTEYYIYIYICIYIMHTHTTRRLQAMKKAKGVDHELDMDLPADATAEDIAWLKKNKAAAEMMSLQSTLQKIKI
jgi:hypothetical protein